MSIPVLKRQYLETVCSEMMKTQGYANRHQVPLIEKIVINSGVGSQHEKGAIEEAVKDLRLLTGQKPVVTKARSSISNFKLREGSPIGVKVTLRSNYMYEFLLRFTSVALPGIRDFRGISSKLDGHGNLSIGISDHTIFPEISMDGNRRLMGMDITIVTTAETDAEGHELLRLMGLPFRKR